MNNLFQCYITKNAKRFRNYEVNSIKNIKISETSLCTLFIFQKYLYKEIIITKFSSNESDFIFYECNGNSGFLAKKCIERNEKLQNKTHAGVFDFFGVIIDLFQYNSIPIINNIVEAFPGNSINGLGEFEGDYLSKCLNSKKKVTDGLLKLSTIAYEANGNLFQYSASGDLFIYAHDHCYEELNKLNLEPDYTFYQHPALLTVNDFVARFFSGFLE